MLSYMIPIIIGITIIYSMIMGVMGLWEYDKIVGFLYGIS